MIAAECPICALQQNDKIAPAKGAMAFAAASLYWCRWQGWGRIKARLAMIAREETCVN
jgi:hypothetical protein